MNYHLVNSKGDIIYSNIPAECILCYRSCNKESEIIENCRIDGKKHKRGLRNSELGSVYFCSSDKDVIKSSRLFKEKLKIYSELLENLNQ